MDRWSARARERLTDDGDARNFIQNEEKGRKESESGGGDGKFNGSGIIDGDGGEAILFSTLFSGISQRRETRKLPWSKQRVKSEVSK